MKNNGADKNLACQRLVETLVRFKICKGMDAAYVICRAYFRFNTF